MKKTLLILLFPILLFSQNSADRKVYMDSLFRDTSNLDSPYYRIIEDENTEKEEYKFKVFYQSGKIFMEGTTLSKTHMIPEGLINTYFENGNPKEEYIIAKGNNIGTKTTWHKNGTKKSIMEFSKEIKELLPSVRILQFWDTDKVQKVVDGNGFFEDEENGCYEKGQLQNGVRVGQWTGIDKKFKVHFIEEYKEGNLIMGTSTDSTSSTYNYTKVKEGAKPRKGYEHFYNYIGKKFRFTKETEGKSAKIHLSFVVEKDGSISDIKILKSGGDALDKECIRLITNYPDWEPGKYRGKKARLLFSIPITIKAP